ncbi:MAG: FAD-dependent oxidoreductase [Pseudomonadota bacterium]
MPFEMGRAAPKRVAVIGGGISGLGAAHFLAGDHSVVLFEAAPRLGGHARTVIAGKRGDQPVDTGFIVFNHTNYPLLTQLFEELEVETAPSRMSFGASFDGGKVEYALNSVRSIFAQPSNLARPAFLRMLRDIMHFNKHARDAVEPGMTIGALSHKMGLGDWFRTHYIGPFSGAIWSTPSEKILDFPAEAMIRFFENHALMGYHGQHQWHTVQGGSVNYVERLARRLDQRGVDLRVATPVAGVRRTGLGVEVRAVGGEWEGFDEVVFATHSDDTLRLLEDARGPEREALSAIRYQPNEAVLHCDERVMPKRRACWASWVYASGRGETPGRIGLSYWMNSLQPIPQDDPMFVTLNATETVREDKIYDQTTFSHPVYTTEALAAQERLRAMNGTRRTWFCGAWMRNGFHEDGLASAMDVVEAMAARSPAVLAAE